MKNAAFHQTLYTKRYIAGIQICYKCTLDILKLPLMRRSICIIMELIWYLCHQFDFMNITFQYYNEIVLSFADYEVDYRDGVIVIDVPVSNKPFDIVSSKIEEQLTRIAGTLEPRDREVTIRVERKNETKDIVLGIEPDAELEP